MRIGFPNTAVDLPPPLKEAWLGDDAVERAPLEVQRLSLLAGPLLAGAQRPEVLRRLWHDVCVQRHFNAAGLLVPDGDVQEALRIGWRQRGLRADETKGKCSPSV